jgi:hypothetical protein
VLVELSVSESARMFRLNVWDSLRNFVCDNFHGAGRSFVRGAGTVILIESLLARA